MVVPAPARNTQERRADVETMLDTEVDAWVASAGAAGDAYLIPLSFAWDGTRLIMATPESSITARNLSRAGWVRLALGATRDVVIIEGPVEVTGVGDDAMAEFHASRAGFDVRDEDGPWVFMSVTPQRVQAWREVNELKDRLLMVDGRWLA